MAKNPVPLIIPCHRVLAAGGKVGGFSAPGGATSKVHMLELEGVRFSPPEPARNRSDCDHCDRRVFFVVGTRARREI